MVSASYVHKRVMVSRSRVGLGTIEKTELHLWPIYHLSSSLWANMAAVFVSGLTFISAFVSRYTRRTAESFSLAWLELM